jgi:hypothetical protein
MGSSHGLPAVRNRWVLERHWGEHTPLPRRWIFPRPARTAADTTPREPLDFTGYIHRVCTDITRRCPPLAHIDPGAVLFSFTRSRKRSYYGLQARVTPMRFRDGLTARRSRGTVYHVQRYFVDRREVLYLVTFCLPRFFDQPFEEKLVTIFHELYHIGERFDGDLRRHGGRYDVHSHSKKQYDGHMARLAAAYLSTHPQPDLLNILRLDSPSLRRAYHGVHGVAVPRPKMIPAHRETGT